MNIFSAENLKGKYNAEFSGRTVASLSYAQNEARILRKGKISQLHLLLGVFTDPLFAQLFPETIDASVIRGAALPLLGNGPYIPYTLTARAERSLVFSIEEAEEFGDMTVKPEHLVLELAREGSDLLDRVLDEINTSMHYVKGIAIKGLKNTQNDL